MIDWRKVRESIGYPMTPKEEYERRKSERQRAAPLDWSAVLRSTPGRILAVVAGIGVFWTFIERTYDAFQNTSPEIQMVGQDAAPFSLPFFVKNKSSFFDMREVEFRCATDTTQIGQLTFINTSFKDSRPPALVRAGKSAAFRCPITNMKTGVRSTVFPIVKY